MLDSTSFSRIIKTGIVSFWRNIWLSAGATMVMTVTLVIFSMLFLLFSITRYSVKNIQERVDISVYLKNNLMEDKAQKFMADILGFPEVKEVHYVSPSEVLAEFKDKNQDKPKVLAALNEVSENPFGATLRIKAKNLEDYPQISEKLLGESFNEYIKEINYDDNRAVIQKLSQILKIIVSFGSGLVAGLAGIAILVIFNTITLIINNRKEEVEIMRLVGATNWYIRGPFLSESILYALASTVVTLILFFPVYKFLLPKVLRFVSSDPALIFGAVFNFGYLALAVLGLALVLSIVSTLLAIRKFLKI